MKKKIIIITSIILTILAVAASSVYALWYISVNRKIDPADITPDLVKAYIESETREYNGKYQIPLSSKLDNSKLTYTYNGTTIYQNGSCVNQSSSPIDADTYVIQVSYETGESQAEPIDISFTINPKELNASSLEPTSELVYNGSSQTPEYDISDLLLDRDKGKVSITATSTNTINASTNHSATLSLTGDNASNYTLSTTTKQFSISPKPITLNWSNYSNLVYNGSQQTISCSVNGLVASDTITPTLTYYKDGINTSSTSKCTYAGSYKIEASLPATVTNYELSGDNYIEFVVAKKNLYIGSATLQYNYDSNNRSWSYFKSYLASNMPTSIFNGLCTNDEITIVVSGMNDGTFGYGDDYSTYLPSALKMGVTEIYLSSNVIGSTYVVSLDLDNLFSQDNVKNSYNIVKNGTILFKYKTVLISSTYYTIEDAIIKSSSNIILQGNGPDNSTYVATAFSKILPTSEYNLDNRTLLVPYQSTTSATDYKGQDTSVELVYSNAGVGNVYSALLIPENITLNLSGSNLGVAAFIGYKQGQYVVTIVQNRGILYNNGTINVKNSSTIYSYGYIKGDGNIVVNNSSIIDCLTTYDWPGGSVASDIYSDILVTNAWSLHNISCLVDIHEGSTYSGYIYTSLSKYGFTRVGETTATVLGSSSTSNCIFKINSGYLRKKTVNAAKWIESPGSYSTEYGALKSVTGSNQIAGQRDVFELHGEFEDAKLSINLTINLIIDIPIYMETNNQKPASVGFMDIYVMSDSTLKLTTSDYVFLPGSTVKIEKGATVEVSSEIDISILTTKDFEVDALKSTTAQASYYRCCVDKVDAKFIVDGTLIMDGNLGGYVNTTESGAELSLSSTASNTSTYKILCSASGNIYTGTKTVTANVGGTDNSNLSINSYYISVEGLNNEIYWMASDEASQFYINFYDNDYSTLLDSYTKTSIDNSYQVTGNEWTSSKNKEFYEIDYWEYQKSDGTYERFDPNNTENIGLLSPGETLNLYAVWKPIEFNFNFSAVILHDDESTTLIDNSDENLVLPATSFTIEDFNGTSDTSILTIGKASYSPYFFDGWYEIITTDPLTISSKMSSITISDLRDYISQNITTISLYCRFSINYTISFVNGYNEASSLTPTTITGISSESYTLTATQTAAFNDINDTNTYSKYFEGWYYDSAFTNKCDNNQVSLVDYVDDNGNVTLYAKWIDKEYKVIYDVKTDDNTSLLSTTEYYTELQNSNGSIRTREDTFDEQYATSYGVTLGVKYTFDNSLWYDENDNSYENGSTITLTSSSITLTRSYTTSYLLTTSSSNSSITVVNSNNTNETYSNNQYILAGTYINVSVTYNSRTDDRSTTLTIGNSTETSSTDKSDSIKTETPWTNKEVTGPVTISSTANCLVEGTLITLVDGTKKKVEDITSDDYLLVFNHETGQYDSAQVLFNDYEELSEYTIINLEFSNGSKVRIVYDHGFFDLTLNKYVYITESNYLDYVGHQFYAIDYDDITNINSNVVTLTKAYITNEKVRLYSPVTIYHLNYFTEDILSMPGNTEGFVNIFEYGDNLQYDQDQIQADIEEYGLLGYEAFEDLVPYEIYLAFPAKYFNIAIGKGLLTWDEVYALIDRYSKYWS